MPGHKVPAALPAHVEDRTSDPEHCLECPFLSSADLSLEKMGGLLCSACLYPSARTPLYICPLSLPDAYTLQTLLSPHTCKYNTIPPAHSLSSRLQHGAQNVVPRRTFEKGLDKDGRSKPGLKKANPSIFTQ